MKRHLPKNQNKSNKSKSPFLIHRKVTLFLGCLLIALLLLVNPFPSSVTIGNVWGKLVYTIVPIESELVSQAYIDTILSQDGAYILANSTAIFHNQKIPPFATPLQSQFATNISLVKETVLTSIAGAEDNKWIEVDLSEQKLFVWENGQKVLDFTVSTGKPWTPTITGEYRIWIKLRYANMTGGSKARGDYYNLPNVPYVMYFHKGYGIHGTYWHNNFGTQMSHGCVNLRTEDAEKIFYWASPDMQGKSVGKPTPENLGTRVVIHQ